MHKYIKISLVSVGMIIAIGSIMNIKTEFWNCVNIGGINECWDWKWSLDRKGYGQVNTYCTAKNNINNCKHHICSRVAYSISRMLYNYYTDELNIPNGIAILHTCDNPKCCNPWHLTTGSLNDNNQDMFNKGRGFYKLLDNSKVPEIRKLYAEGGHTHRSLGKQFECDHTIISDILNHKGRFKNL